MTIQPALAAFGAHSFETEPPAENSAMSTLEKSNCSRSLHFRVRSPKETSRPMLLREATA